MNVIPFVHEGLGNSSYLVEVAHGRALLVDPDRTVARYLAMAEARGLRIEAVLETHLHADFVSGAREIYAATNAMLFLPRGGASQFPHVPVDHAARIHLDGFEVEPVASPGHTPEHMSYVLRDASGAITLFSGGSVIVGGAARSDLVAPDLTEGLTRDQFRTLRSAFAALPDATLLYPTHGGGSFCSTGGGAKRTSTLGEERAHNPAMSFDDEDEFARWFPSTFPAIPAYFARMRGINQAGPPLRRDIAMPGPIDASALAVRRRDVTIIDARPAPAYLEAHIPHAMSIPFRDTFALWLGWLADPDSPLVIVTDDAALVPRIVDEALLVGYERFAGYLDGGMAAWQAAGLSIQGGGAISVDEASPPVANGALFIDVREPDEFATGHLEGAVNIPLGSLQSRADGLAGRHAIVVYCQAGDRSASAVSLLERAGIRARSLLGGIDAWQTQ